MDTLHAIVDTIDDIGPRKDSLISNVLILIVVVKAEYVLKYSPKSGQMARIGETTLHSMGLTCRPIYRMTFYREY